MESELNTAMVLKKNVINLIGLQDDQVVTLMQHAQPFKEAVEKL